MEEVFFFFQAEDGIRDADVTGVQTCALPISIRTITSAAEAIERLEFDQPFHRRSRLREIDDAGHSLDKARGALKWFGAYVPHRLVFRLMELGEDAVRSRSEERRVGN